MLDDDPETPPVNPVPVGAPHVNEVPAGMIPLMPSVGVTLKVAPVQIVAVIGVIVAIALTVTTSENWAPVQLPDNGVTIYVAVFAEHIPQPRRQGVDCCVRARSGAARK